MKIVPSFENVVKTSGVALLVAFFLSIGTVATAPLDSGRSEFGNGAVRAVCCLYLAWAAAAITALVLRWRSVRKSFWAIFGVNMCIVALLMVAYLSNGKG